MRFYPTRHFVFGGPLKRHARSKGRRLGALPAEHPAITESRTKYPSTVIHPVLSPRLLVSGFNSRKIGKKITKGRWRDMPIYTLTLEERATCPRSCREWATCYGNNMNWARRHIAGPALEAVLLLELADLQDRNPRGFAIRLHVLGDFYSTDYVRLWQLALRRFPALRIFGFTAHAPDSHIGEAIAAMNDRDRCWIRFSGLDSIVVTSAADTDHVICPAQTQRTDCCGTCGLCWTMNRPLAFVRH